MTTPSTFLSKPSPHIIGLDTTHHLYTGLVTAIAPNKDSHYEHIGGSGVVSRGSNTDWLGDTGIDSRNPKSNATDGSGHWAWKAPSQLYSLIGKTTCTVLIWANLDTAVNGDNIISIPHVSTGWTGVKEFFRLWSAGGSCMMNWTNNAISGSVNLQSTGGYWDTSGVATQYVIVRNGDKGKFFKDTKIHSTATANELSSPFKAPVNQTYINFATRSIGSNNDGVSGALGMVLIWDRVISEDDIASLYRDPYQLFRMNDMSILSSAIETVPAIRFTSTFNQKWQVDFFRKETSSFNQEWQVSSPNLQSVSILNQNWQVDSVIPSTSNLNQSWSVFKFTPVTSTFNQNWAIDPVAIKSKVNNLGQKWQVDSVIKVISNIQQNWKIFIRGKVTSSFNQSWIIDPVAVKSFSNFHNKYKIFVLDKTQSTLGQSWIVNAPLPTFSSLNQKWSIDPVVTKGLPSRLNQKWSVFSGPFTAWVLPYSIKVSTPWALPYNAIVSQSWILPSLGTVSKSWELPYSLATALAKQFELIWDLDTGNDVAQEWVLPYNYGKVSAQWQLTYSLSTPVAQQWVLEYGLTFPVAQQWSLDWDINTFDNVKQSWKLVYAWIGPEIINISGQPTITLNGNVIDVFDAEISTDEEGFIWQAEITLLDIADYKSINIDDQFTLDFYGEIFTLLTESKTLDRASPVGIAMTVRAVSPAIRHDFPRAAPLTITFNTPVTAQATAESILGESITWDIPDWTIPANRLGIADGAPIQLVQQIVSAVGGVLESNPDGTLIARPKFPVSMNILEDDAQTPAIDQNYFDTADNLSVSEEYTPQKLFNKFRISDTTKEFDDDLDFDFDEITEEDGSTTKSDTEGLLKAFVKPFRTNVVVKSSQDASIGFQLNGINTEQLTELVEIKEGIGSVSKPILSIDSFTYEAIDLGTPTFVVDDTQIVTPNVNLKYGLLEITYTTRFIEYDVTGVNGKNVQFVLETIDI